jgi:hypothetical protein
VLELSEFHYRIKDALLQYGASELLKSIASGPDINGPSYNRADMISVDLIHKMEQSLDHAPYDPTSSILTALSLDGHIQPICGSCSAQIVPNTLLSMAKPSISDVQIFFDRLVCLECEKHVCGVLAQSPKIRIMLGRIILAM